MKTSLLYGALHLLYNRFGNSIVNVFSFLIIHSYNRVYSITRVHTTTWDYFTKSLAGRFIGSPKVVKEEIMIGINDLVKDSEFGTSNNGAVGAFIAKRRLFEILLGCFNFLNVRFDIISVFTTVVDLADKNL